MTRNDGPIRRAHLDSLPGALAAWASAHRSRSAAMMRRRQAAKLGIMRGIL